MKSDWYKCNTNVLRNPAEEIRKARMKAYGYFKKGWTKRKAAQQLLLHERTIGRWYERFKREGDPRTWRPSRGARAGDMITGGKEDLIAHIRDIIHSKSPRDFGLQGTQWDATALASYIESKYGTRPSLRTAYRYLQKLHSRSFNL